jgi:hypothetical protein
MGLKKTNGACNKFMGLTLTSNRITRDETVLHVRYFVLWIMHSESIMILITRNSTSGADQGLERRELCVF